jgi:uncharacterized protein YegJ (DUF2314 family)
VTSRPKPTALSGCEGAGTPRAGGTAITPLETANGIGDFVPSLRCSEEIELAIVRSCWLSDMPRHRINALLLCLSAASCTTPLTGRTRTSEPATAQSEEPAQRRAAEQAQATLDDFLTKASQQPAGTSAYALKVSFQEGRDTETFWIDEFTWSDGVFTGRINNEPRVMKAIKIGQVYQFSRSQIVDWKYFDAKTGQTVGNFSAPRS